MSAKEKCEDKKDESEECEETDGIQYSDNDINNFINKAFITCDYKGFILILFLRARVFR